MAANLLLEGPDLEALLVRAHREGGTRARIVRAEKVRKGGVFGFFATEAFEVAVEIPADGSAAEPADGWPDGPAPAVAEATPIPTGLLGLAERVDAQERAAIASTASTLATAPTLAGETISRVPEYQFADRTLGTIPGIQRPVFPDHGSWPTGGALSATALPVLAEDDDVQVLHEPEMAAPPIRLAEQESAQPPAARPQFTSLIDQLRDGVRDGRHREEGVRHTTDHPVVAALHTEHTVSALEAEAWARVTTPAGDLDVQGSTTQIGTDGSTMSDIAAERPQSDLGRLTDEPEETTSSANSALTNARASTIVPSKPGRRRGRGVPSQRHSEPVTEDVEDVVDAHPTAVEDTPADVEPELGAYHLQADDELGTWTTDPTPLPSPATTVVPGAHRAPEAGAEAEAHPDEHEFDDQPRKASWWKLGRKRREDVTEQALLWTPSDETFVPMGHEDEPGDLPAERFEPAPRTVSWPEQPAESVPEPRSGGTSDAEPMKPIQPAAPAAAPMQPLRPITPPPGFEPLIASADVHTGPHTGTHRISPQPDVTEDDDLLAELGVEQSPAMAVPGARTGGFTAAALQGGPAMPAASVIEDDELAEDRQTLRDLGIPAAWTRRLQTGDRFTSVLGILDRMPGLDISPDSAVIAVVGPADVVQLEAHRTALDLPADGRPRAVAVLPAGEGTDYRAALAAANKTRPVVVAVPIAEGADMATIRATIADVHADAVIAVIDASLSIQEMTEYFDALERVDAVAMDGALEAEQPAAVLALDVPVVRLDGISMDRIGWAALLCAQLAARNLAAVGAEAG